MMKSYSPLPPALTAAGSARPSLDSEWIGSEGDIRTDKERLERIAVRLIEVR